MTVEKPLGHKTRASFHFKGIADAVNQSVGQEYLREPDESAGYEVIEVPFGLARRRMTAVYRTTLFSETTSHLGAGQANRYDGGWHAVEPHLFNEAIIDDREADGRLPALRGPDEFRGLINGSRLFAKELIVRTGGTRVHFTIASNSEALSRD
jgi:hypothetical protein